MTPNDYINTLPAVIQYRQAYFEIRGNIAPGDALPTTRAWPNPNNSLSYREKLISGLPLTTGKGVELGPLNIPLVDKSNNNVLYVDHCSTEELKKKYPTVPNIVEVDRPIVNNSLERTLSSDAPFDYIIGSQVFEHTANPIQWLQEMKGLLRPNGLLALSIPDRRRTFDLFREETRAADIVDAYIQNNLLPNTRCVYDHHSLASLINMNHIWSINSESIIQGYGAVKPKVATEQYLNYTYKAKEEYLDIHAWVFTPPTFLLVMAQLAKDGFLPFKLYQFYPTNLGSPDRDDHSFTVILENSTDDSKELRLSYLQPLGNN